MIAFLFEDEDEARETLQRFDFEMHSLKRNIENLNLPGSKDYLDYFFVVSDEAISWRCYWLCKKYGRNHEAINHDSVGFRYLKREIN